MPTVYSFATKTPNQLTEGKTLSHFENQPNDGARVSIQGIGNGPMTVDASASIVSSPVIVSTTLATTLTTPESAIEITLCPIGHALNVSEVNNTLSSYFQVPANTPITMDIANCQFLYLQGVGALATTAFYYTLV